MTVDVRLVDGAGKGIAVEVGSRGFLQAAIREGDPPPQGEPNRFRFFSQLVSSVGDGTGTTNMNVNGSVTAQRFTVNAHNDYDIRIMKLLIYVRDASVVHAEIGNIGALSNGVDISMFESGQETFLVNAAKTFSDFVRQTFMAAPFGSDASSFELTNVVGTTDAFALPMNVFELVPNGLRIGQGTKDRLQVEVNDDMSGLDEFTVRVAGYRQFP